MDQAGEEYLVQRLRERLAEDPRVGELGISVTVKGAKVFLGGEVVTEERRRAVAEVALEVLPDHELYNGVTVADVSEDDGMEMLS